jgi:hypothetical protein
MCQRDKELLYGLLKQLEAKGVCVGRRVKDGFALKAILEDLRIPVETARRKDIEDLSVLIQKKEYARTHGITEITTEVMRDARKAAGIDRTM